MQVLILISTLAIASSAGQKQLARLEVRSQGDMRDSRIGYQTVATTTEAGDLGNSRSKMLARSELALVDVDNAALCSHLKRTLKLNGCLRSKGSLINVLQQRSDHAHALPAEHWPLQHCALPLPRRPAASGLENHHSAEAVKDACATVAFATSATGVEFAWEGVPAGSILVVPLLRNSTSQTVVQPSQLVWQSMYRLNSHKYYAEFHDMKAPELGLPDLQFATFFHGYGLLQKADWKQDILRTQEGRFYKLAQKVRNDRISEEQNYSLLYHRHLDTGDMADEQDGVLLAIGSGCSLKYGLRKSPEIWTRSFKNLAVHLLYGEADRGCLAHWMSTIHSLGVAKLHIGQVSQEAHLWNMLKQKEDPLPTIKQVAFGGHSNLNAVIASDIGDNDEMEADFRGIFPKLKHGGSYFLEDIMKGTWGNPWNMPLTWRYARTASTPLALSASMAVAAAGLSDDLLNLPKDQAAAKLLELRNPPQDFISRSFSFAGKLMKDFQVLIGSLSRENDEDKIQEKARVWTEDLMVTHGRMVDFVECSPGICVFRRK